MTGALFHQLSGSFMEGDLMIHQYKMNGFNIVLDTYSASVHVTDDVTYDAIALLDQGKTKQDAAARLKESYSITDGETEDVFSDIQE